MLNPLTTREFSAQKLEDTPDSGHADASGESSERWLTLSVSAPCHFLKPATPSERCTST